jgi:hypothetical protein
MIGSERPQASPASNIRQQGTRFGNWLIREQAKKTAGRSDRSTLKGSATM